MTEDREAALTVLQDLLTQPTAPFHEEWVAARVRAYLREWDVPFSLDEGGNIIARYQRGPACRPLILMAHMDHPGFTISGRGGPGDAHWTAVLEGGVAAACFDRQVPVRIYPRTDRILPVPLPGRVVSYAVDTALRVVTLHMKLESEAAAASVQPGDFGVWDLTDFELRDDIIHARAIDDLAGCAAMLLVLRRAAREGWPTELYAVFTRAEEVGLVGAEIVLRGSALPREGYIVSLEASKALPGALQGSGPVIRTGDRLTTFSQEAELVLKAAAQRLGSDVWPAAPGMRAEGATTKVQRQLMSGGRCEASAAVMLGYQATGLAFPLGNYHNVAEGSVLAPENIHADDFLTGVALLSEAAKLMPGIEQLRATHYDAYAPHKRQIDRLRAAESDA